MTTRRRRTFNPRQQPPHAAESSGSRSREVRVSANNFAARECVGRGLVSLSVGLREALPPDKEEDELAPLQDTESEDSSQGFGSPENDPTAAEDADINTAIKLSLEEQQKKGKASPRRTLRPKQTKDDHSI